MTDKSKLPMWFWVASVAGLLWNLLGVSAFFMQIFMSPETLAEMPEAQRMALEANPIWFTIAYGVSVITGALGCIYMLKLNKLALLLFLISFVSVLVQMLYSFLLSEHIVDYGPGELVMPMMIVFVSLLLISFASNSKQKNWIS